MCADRKGELPPEAAEKLLSEPREMLLDLGVLRDYGARHDSKHDHATRALRRPRRPSLITTRNQRSPTTGQRRMASEATPASEAVAFVSLEHAGSPVAGVNRYLPGRH
jgi:hypothetical protein